MGGIYMATPQEILRNPFLNKGTGFSKEEREEPGCTGVFCWEQTNKQNKQI